MDHKVTIQSHSYSERQCCCALGVAVVGAWWAADPALCFVWQAWIDSVNADKLEVKVPQTIQPHPTAATRLCTYASRPTCRSLIQSLGAGGGAATLCIVW